MRILSTDFIDHLQRGILTRLRDRVLADRGLCMELRENYVNVYYRGGSLLKLTAAVGGYDAFFDPKYAEAGVQPSLDLPAGAVREQADLDSWLMEFPSLKQAMDLFFGQHPRDEREIQQLIVRDNNFGGVARATDYYFCDIEYRHDAGQIDMVGVHWPSVPSVRKRADGRRLVLAEVKHGDDALEGASGLHAHIKHINSFLADPSRVRALKKEMLSVFNQKRALGLIDCGKDLSGFSEETPVLLLLLANHDPDKSCLGKLLRTLPSSPHAELRLAGGCLMGYGLFDVAVVSIDQADRRFGTCF